MLGKQQKKKKNLLWSDETKAEHFDLNLEYNVWCKINTADHPKAIPSVNIMVESSWCGDAFLHQEE